MIVQELIEFLSACNPKAEVGITTYYGELGKYEVIERAYELANDTTNQKENGIVCLVRK